MNQSPSLEEEVRPHASHSGRELVRHFFLATALLAAAQVWAAFDGAAGVRNVVIPIYTERQSSPAAVLRVSRVSEGHQRKGFFRIGVLPTVVIENTVLEIRSDVDFSNVLHQAHSELVTRPELKRVIDGRGFSIVFSAHTNSWVQAGRMSLGSPGIWRLEDVSVGNPNSPLRTFRRAALQVTGPRAGELRGETRAEKISILLPIVIATVNPNPLHHYETPPPPGMSPHLQ